MSIPSLTNDYEIERARIMEENRRKMEEMGLLRQKSIIESFAPCKRVDAHRAPNNKAKQPSLGRRERYGPARRSTRLQGVKLDEGALRSDVLGDDEHEGGSRRTYGGLLDLLDRSGKVWSEDVAAANNAEIQQIRCSSAGRGSLYDKTAGITCHFCRQKKLCGEPDCPRCQSRNVDLECKGKSDCSRCHSANGRFCRACLLIRYGEELDDVRRKMKAGNWLCPHCYEEEHADEGWICNSSICMTRRGLKPTGIAIYDAMQQGFKSVGHLLQSQLQKRGGIAGIRNECRNDTTFRPDAASRQEAVSSEGDVRHSAPPEQAMISEEDRELSTLLRKEGAAPVVLVRGRGRPPKPPRYDAASTAAGSSAGAAAKSCPCEPLVSEHVTSEVLNDQCNAQLEAAGMHGSRVGMARDGSETRPKTRGRPPKPRAHFYSPKQEGKDHNVSLRAMKKNMKKSLSSAHAVKEGCAPAPASLAIRTRSRS
ncbi:hypothetical protein CEUSTIGMA_g2653.t1 [Chlamydomonas eustigma]|uniref:Zinc-finger domain-containing protein n=1 Tax=Chlamydomonas eustigma TaxID=1157962 RepID=A0A250WWY4_9CHLO|nr:hypothetical protein CEUSTIGMA_g2653.t1 [Chlamydomonas eustigma]|eukprot:GAX75209.1 hypothetical protein CEUSTIGMA_g2653.t1 [Chlamydomonas eustigma]